MQTRLAGWFKKYWMYLILGLFLVLGAGLRLYRLEDLMIFLGDQGRDVTIVQGMIDTGQPALLGPGSGVGHFQRGPAYYYLLLPALWLGGGEPLSAAMFIVFVDVACIAMVFVVGREWVGADAGITAALLYACAQVPLVVARVMSNPALLPLLTLVMLYSVWRVIQGQERFFLLLVAAWLVSWQLHDQVWLLIPLFAVALVYFKVRLRPRILALATILTLLLLAPFLFNEATHNATNIRLMLDYVRSAGAERAGEVGISKAPARVWETLWVLQRALTSMLWLRAFWIAAVSASSLVLLRRLRHETQGVQFLFLYALLPFMYAFWPGPIYELNVAIVIPMPFLLLGYGFHLLAGKRQRLQYVGIPFVGLLAVINAYEIYNSTRDRQLGFESYGTLRHVVEILRTRVGEHPFALEYIVKTQNQDFTSPLLYLLKRSGAVVTADGEARRFRVFYPAELGATEPGIVYNDIKVSGYSPPQPYGKNLFKPLWQRRVRGDKTTRLDATQMDIVIPSSASGKSVTFIQRIGLKPNELYLMRFQCRNESAHADQRVYVQPLDARADELKTSPTGSGFLCPASPEWTRGAILMQTPAQTKQARVFLINGGPGTVWFRNVQMQHAVLSKLPETP